MEKRKVNAKKNEHCPKEPAEENIPERLDKVVAPDSPEVQVDTTAGNKKQQKKLLYTVTFFYEWCKSCGICSALCPQKIILQDETGKPFIETMDNCIGCRFCEVHCPDFAITVKERYPDRRRKENGSK